MNDKWKKSRLKDFVLLQRGHDLPKGQRGKGNIPVAGSSGIVGFHDQSIGVVPGVTIGRSGTIGNTNYFEEEYFPLNTTLYVTNFQGNDPKFVYYFFSRFDFLAFDSGSVQPSLNRNFLYTAKVNIPPLQEQKAIAHILSMLDKKIELNKRTNQTIEEISKTLFKSWFIDFDPVKAKVANRTTGFKDEISVLFPNSFDDSEVGNIPSSWEVESLDNVAEFLNGLPLQKFPAKGEINDLPVIKIVELRKGNTLGADKCSNDIGVEYVIRDGDILFSWSGSLVVDIWTGGKGALNQHLFKVDSSKYKKWFYYYWINHHLHEFQAIAEEKATSMGHIKRHHLTQSKVLIPPSDLLTKMDLLFDPLIERQIKIRLQIRTLIELRNTLLPKLISGKLEIHDAEKMIEEAEI